LNSNLIFTFLSGIKMKKYLTGSLILILTSLFIFSCKSTTEPVDTGTGEGEATISGIVVDNTTGSIIQGAEVNIYNGSSVIGKTTDAEGRFAANLTIEKSKEILVYTKLNGYYSDSTNVSATAGVETKVTIKLQKKTVGADISGNPASIVLVSTSAQNIGIKGSGSVESAYVTFEVQDSSGNSINMSSSVLVNFVLGLCPGGGEYINPTAVKTNANGRVTVSISSGTKAGVIQFIAMINFNGTEIISKPVNIAVHGGHPDQTHFSVATQYLNIPGWHIDAFPNTITAIVGDKYANPVKPKTAVYFTTTGGIIEGSALTNDMGLAPVTLLSGNPRPVHPLLGAGFAEITATTADENKNVVIGKTIVLFSGEPRITVSPTQFPNIPHAGSTTIYYTVKDLNDNPIAPGNSITVSVVEGSKVYVAGDVNFSTMDTQSKDATNYSFRIFDGDTGVGDYIGPRTASIQIKVQGPNGYTTATISGTLDYE
jgi:hypothetical protein